MLDLFDATKFCIRPVSNNLNREAGEMKLKMPAQTGRKQWKWAHEMDVLLVLWWRKGCIGQRAAEQELATKVMHCQNYFVISFKSIGLSIYEWGKDVCLLRVKK